MHKYIITQCLKMKTDFIILNLLVSNTKFSSADIFGLRCEPEQSNLSTLLPVPVSIKLLTEEL